MNLLPFAADRLRPVLKLAALSLAIAGVAPFASAQTPSSEPAAAEQRSPEQRPQEKRIVPEEEEVFAIQNATAQTDMNDLQTALRNMLPRAGIYGDFTQSAIAIRATAEDLEKAKRLIGELDHPRKAWRVTYTITDTENGSRLGVQHVTIAVIAGRKTVVKQGNRVPLVTGMQQGPTADQNAQIQYIDVGLNIEADIDGGLLRTKIEQSGVAEEKSGFGAQDPVVHQTMLEGMANLATGKAVVLGSLDVPGTTHHQEIEVTCEPLT